MNREKMYNLMSDAGVIDPTETGDFKELKPLAENVSSVLFAKLDHGYRKRIDTGENGINREIEMYFHGKIINGFDLLLHDPNSDNNYLQVTMYPETAALERLSISTGNSKSTYDQEGRLENLMLNYTEPSDIVKEEKVAEEIETQSFATALREAHNIYEFIGFGFFYPEDVVIEWGVEKENVDETKNSPHPTEYQRLLIDKLKEAGINDFDPTFVDEVVHLTRASALAFKQTASVEEVLDHVISQALLEYRLNLIQPITNTVNGEVLVESIAVGVLQNEEQIVEKELEPYESLDFDTISITNTSNKEKIGLMMFSKNRAEIISALVPRNIDVATLFRLTTSDDPKDWQMALKIAAEI